MNPMNRMESNSMRLSGALPALVMWGGDSRALSPETAQAFVDAMKNAASTEKIIFDGGGHFLHISRPEATGRAVKEFLDRTIGGAAQ